MRVKESDEEQTIIITPGKYIRVVAQSSKDNSGSTKKGKDTKKEIDRLIEEKNTLEREVKSLHSDIDIITQKKRATIEGKIKGLRGELALTEDSLAKLKATTSEEIKKHHAITLKCDLAEAKLRSVAESNVSETQEYNAKCSKMRKEMNAHVLVAKNKVNEYNSSYERLTSKYAKMEMDMNEMEKEKERIRLTQNDLKEFDKKLNDREAALNIREAEVKTKESWFNAGQKKYREEYEKREQHYLKKVGEYNLDLQKLAGEQKALAENWENLRIEKAKIGSSERNKKRVK